MGAVRHFYWSDSNHHDDRFSTGPYPGNGTEFWDDAAGLLNRDTECYVRVFKNVNNGAPYETLANTPTVDGRYRSLEHGQKRELGTKICGSWCS